MNTEILKAKRANAERIKDFSKQLQDFNKASLSEQRRLPQSSELSDVQVSKRRLESNRERAIQFSRGIPKPAIKLKNSNSNSNAERKGDEEEEGEEEIEERFRRKNHSNNDDDDDDYDGGWGLSSAKASKLRELQLKHLESKKNIDAMKRSMGM